MQLFLPITKVDAAKRLVYGTLAEEVPDRAGEILDYASSKPNFERWSAEVAKASDGRSVGNLRAMHGKTAAGKLEQIRFADGERRIEAVAKVVDDAEWNKVLEGVYTGFSIGGKYAKRWKDAQDPSLTRYTAEPSEVSLVDNPCIPTATFAMVKADGSEERRRFKHAAPIEKSAVGEDVWQGWVASDGSAHRTKREAAERNASLAAAEIAKAAAAPAMAALEAASRALDAVAAAPDTQKDYSASERQAMAATGEAMRDGSFPIHDRMDLKHAIRAYGRAKNRSAARRHIARRAKALGLADMLPEDWMEPATTQGQMGSDKSANTADLHKNLYFIGNMVTLLAAIESMEDSYEQMIAANAADGADGADNRDLADKFGLMLAEFGDLVSEMLDRCVAGISQEETQEAGTAMEQFADATALCKAMVADIAGVDLAKYGARHSKVDLARLQKAHDLLKEMGAICNGAIAADADGDADAGEVADKSAGGNLIKAEAEKAALEKALADLAPQLTALHKRIETLEAQPAPAKGAVMAVSKMQDSGGASALDDNTLLAAIEKMTPDARAMLLVKAARKNPMPYGA